MTDQERDLRRMKATATWLFVAVSALFVVAYSLQDRWPAFEYVRAFAEAAMVGALADWFAVTALFRHPLGIPIPHTAIIPNRKDDIGRGLGTFVQENFLTEEVVGEKLRGMPIASRIGAWLAEPDNARRLGDQASTVARAVLDALSDEEVQEAIETTVAKKVRSTPAGPVLGKGLDLAIADGRHQQLLSAILKKVAESLEANRPTLRERLERESPWWVPDAANNRVFIKLFDGVQALLVEVSDDPDHELRATFDARIRELAEDLKADPEMQARAEQLKDELLDHPALREWSATVWTDLKASVLARSSDPDSALRQRIEAGIVTFGERLRDDRDLQAKVDEWVSSAVVQVVQQSRGEVGDLIATTVERWNPDESTRRIELQVGRDLQFIRINGTVVGGLAGLLIFTISNLF
jgi:uncharacterized membrane-anchored protein YjiN (DUF445 family)